MAPWLRYVESHSARFAAWTAILLALSLAFSAVAQNAPTQTSPAVPTGAPNPLNLDATLQPALRQVGSALRQVQINRWKLSRQWKAQLQNDASSIQQDLSEQLPALMQAGRSSPADLQPQWAVLRNVDALYDVLVRVATAANLSAARDDASVLADALQQLEMARKSATDGLLKAAAQQDHEIVQLRASAQTAQTDHRESEHPKRIVVDNDGSHRTRHRRRVSHTKKAPATSKTPATKPSPDE